MAQQKRGVRTSSKSHVTTKSSGKTNQSRGSSSKWIHSPEEHEEHKGQSLATRDHDVITTWTEERKGQPAVVPGTGRKDSAGILRIDFPGFAELQPTGWDEWFKTFDERRLTFLFQEHKKNGDLSTFFRLQNSVNLKKAA